MLPLVSFLVMGFLGSLHCVGMCGPLVMAMPWNRLQSNTWQKALVYHSARILTYTIIGLIIGSFGQILGLERWQQKISIAVGVLTLIIVFLPNLSIFGKVSQQWNAQTRSLFGKFMKGQTLSSIAALGLINGLLPCGFMSLALVAAAAGGSIAYSAPAMALFGLGTFPAMLFTSVFGQVLFQKLPGNARNYTKYVTVVFALLFILRGANLGIPYLSPAVAEKGMSCCHK